MKKENIVKKMKQEVQGKILSLNKKMLDCVRVLDDIDGIYKKNNAEQENFFKIILRKNELFKSRLQENMFDFGQYLALISSVEIADCVMCGNYEKDVVVECTEHASGKEKKKKYNHFCKKLDFNLDEFTPCDFLCPYYVLKNK